MKRKIILNTTLIVMIVMMSGCASIVSKSAYEVDIKSVPSGANIIVKNRDGEVVHRGTTPITLKLKAGAGYFKGENYTVSFELPGYSRQVVQIERGVDTWYVAGNLLFGGLIGYLVVDPISGAMWTLKDVSVTLSPHTSMSEETEGLIITSIDDVPEDLKHRLVRIL